MNVDGERTSSGGAVLPEVNQSLARLEMNSLEVKLYLDSIDQRISRMEPRLEEMRSADPVAAAAPAVPTVDHPAQQDDAGMMRTTERRRRAQGVPVERRRPPRAVATEKEDREPWMWGAAWRLKMEELLKSEQRAWRDRITTHRRRLPVLVLGVLAVAGLLFWGIGRHDRPSERLDPVAPADAGSVLAAAVPNGLPKSSAGIPWTSGSGVATYHGAATSSKGTTAAPTRLPVVEQGVVAPGYALPAARPSLAAALTSATEKTQGTADADSASPAPNVAEESDPAPASSRSVDAVTPRVAPSSTRRLHVSSGVMAGNLLYSPPPTYPHGIAGLFHTEGRVVMQAIISRNGRVENLHVISGHYVLRGAAKDAVRTWRYRPYYVSGSPVEVATIVSVDFHR